MFIINNKNKTKVFDNIIGFSISVVAVLFYLITAAPSLAYIDSGELATVPYTLGIAHPTGYPLFTLLGYVFSRLPLSLRPIYQLNVFALLLCALGLFFFFRFLLIFFNDLLLKKQKGNDPDELNSGNDYIRRYLGPVAGTVALAFSETYWSTALSVEVYSLHVVFLSILLYLFSRAIQSTWLLRNSTGDEKMEAIHWIIFSYVLGLAFTNHMTTILLAPAFIYFYFRISGFHVSAWKRIIILAAPFLVGFSVYIYLPVESANHPLLSWGNPVDFERFFWHFSGKVYRVWIFSSTESATKQLTYFINTLPAEFGYIFIPVGVIGLWYLFKNRKNLLLFTVILFLSCLGYSINYDIHDIDSYFLLAYAMIAIWIGAGFVQMNTWWKSKKNYVHITVIFFLCTAFVIGNNYSRVDRRGHTLVEKYTKDILDSVEPNGIIISYQWDYFVSAAYYMQVVEKYRPDVVVIDKELLRRTWYYVQLETRYPWLIQNSRTELDPFLRELNKFEHDQPYAPSLIEYRYSALIKSIIEKNITTRPIYVTPEIEDRYTGGFRRVPAGLAFRLYSDEVLHKMRPISFKISPIQAKDNYDEAIVGFYSRAYMNYAIYSEILGENDKILGYLDKAIEIKPDFTEAIYYRNRILRK
jgi:tetratricopeptide (TPR) repeat protein